MRKGIVMEIKGTTGIVMTNDGQFLKVPRLPKSCDVGDEVDVPSSINRGRKYPYRFIIASACTAAMLLIVFFATNLFGTNGVAAAYVTMDINPSVEIGVDAKQRVMYVEGLDQDGKQLVANLKLKGLSLEAAMDQILLEAERLHYLQSILEQGAGSIFITNTLLLDSMELSEESLILIVKQTLERQLAINSEQLSDSIVIVGLSTPLELRDEARSLGVSTAKMAIQLLAQEQGYELSTASLEQQSIHSLSQEFGGIQNLIVNEEQPSKEHLKELVELHKKSDETNVAKKQDEGRDKHQASKQSKNEKKAEQNQQKAQRNQEKEAARKLKEQEKEQEKQRKQQQKEKEKMLKEQRKEQEKVREQETKQHNNDDRSKAQQKKEREKAKEKQEKEQQKEAERAKEQAKKLEKEQQKAQERQQKQQQKEREQKEHEQQKKEHEQKKAQEQQKKADSKKQEKDRKVEKKDSDRKQKENEKQQKEQDKRSRD